MSPDGGTGRPLLRHRVNGSLDGAAKRRRPEVAAAYAAAALAIAYAAVSLYWAAGGTAWLSTVGGSVADVGRRGGLPAVALGLAAAALKLAGGLLALALVRPWGRVMPRAWLLACAAGASVVLACYGAIQVAAGSLVLSGAVRPATTVDWTALRWHVLVWDMWFLIWGIVLAAATVTWWRHGSARTGRKPGPPNAHAVRVAGPEEIRQNAPGASPPALHGDRIGAARRPDAMRGRPETGIKRRSAPEGNPAWPRPRSPPNPRFRSCSSPASLPRHETCCSARTPIRSCSRSGSGRAGSP